MSISSLASHEQALWPLADLPTALEQLAHHVGFAQHDTRLPALPTLPERTSVYDLQPHLRPWVNAAAMQLGCETEAFQMNYAEVTSTLKHCGPALLLAHTGRHIVCLAVCQARRKQLVLLGPDLRRHTIPLETVRSALCYEQEAPLRKEVDDLLSLTSIPASRREEAGQALLREQLHDASIRAGWMLQRAPGVSFWRQLRDHNAPARFAGLLSLHMIHYLMMLGAWGMLGASVLQGRIDRGWLIAWLMLLLTMLPLQMAVAWQQGSLLLDISLQLKRRLLFGVTQLLPEDIRHQGSGQLLAKVLDSQSIESVIFSGGYTSVIAVLELFVAATVLASGAGGLLHAGLFVGCCVVSGMLVYRNYTRHAKWTDQRLAQTNQLVEKMVGHRTRLAQQPKDKWHEGEDQALQNYIQTSEVMDKSDIQLGVVAGGGWMVIGLAGLLPGFLNPSVTMGSLAIGLGGLLLSSRALQKLTGGTGALLNAWIAWENSKQIFLAASRKQEAGDPTFAWQKAQPDTADNAKPKSTPLLQGTDIQFRYPRQQKDVLRDVDIEIMPGDRVLLQGPSGGGKSTLAALLVGLRRPNAGLLLLNGLDHHTLGEAGWRNYVTTAPQFHENHILTGTFAYNLLMGRNWPPTTDDMNEAMSICYELGLGPLLERMPGGLQQMVGESGWQLSHGEKSRVYIARALLQHADMIVLDESFAALDPAHLARALECVRRRAPTLLVIAHP
jgi:ATP-binding cassette subfamily B protein